MTILACYPMKRDGTPGLCVGVESKLLPRAAIAEWARKRVGGYWHLKRCGAEHHNHVLWELHVPAVKRSRGVAGAKLPHLHWKIISCLQRTKIRAPA